MNYEEAKRKIEIYCEHICIWDKDYCNSCENKVAIEALEKQIPKSGNVGFAKFCECPKCEWIIETLEPFNYCPNCGQAIDWSEVE